jgi:hypothetical protein
MILSLLFVLQPYRDLLDRLKASISCMDLGQQFCDKFVFEFTDRFVFCD